MSYKIDFPNLDLFTSVNSKINFYRISNYLLWQGAYAELFFVDTLWPDFRKEQFRAVLSEFALRDRRYGKVK